MPAVRVMDRLLGALPGAPWLKLLSTTRAPSIHTRLPSSLSDRNWYGPAVAMLMNPVHRAATLLVPMLAWGWKDVPETLVKLTCGVNAVTAGVRLPIHRASAGTSRNVSAAG